MLSMDCFLRCLDIVECTSVFVTKNCCYSSSELTPYTLQLDTDTLVYFKRPVHGKNCYYLLRHCTAIGGALQTVS